MTVSKLQIELDGRTIILMQTNGEDTKEKLLKAGFICDTWEVYHAPEGYDLPNLLKLTT